MNKSLLLAGVLTGIISVYSMFENLSEARKLESFVQTQEKLNELIEGQNEWNQYLGAKNLDRNQIISTMRVIGSKYEEEYFQKLLVHMDSKKVRKYTADLSLDSPEAKKYAEEKGLRTLEGEIRKANESVQAFQKNIDLLYQQSGGKETLESNVKDHGKAVNISCLSAVGMGIALSLGMYAFREELSRTT